MKITDVQAYTVLGRSIFVRVFTDEGITGLGECSPMQVQSGVIQQFVNGMLRPLCVGKNPLETDKLYSEMFYRDREVGVGRAADRRSAVERGREAVARADSAKEYVGLWRGPTARSSALGVGGAGPPAAGRWQVGTQGGGAAPR